jgi:hypothetical protein
VNTTPTPELLPYVDADARLDGALSANFLGDYDEVLLLDGDVVLDGDFLKAVTTLAERGMDLIAIWRRPGRWRPVRCSGPLLPLPAADPDRQATARA